MEQYSRRQQEFARMKGSQLNSNNFIPCINQISPGSFQRRSSSSSIGDSRQCCVSEANARANSICWRPQDLPQASTTSSRRGNKPPLIHKRFKLSNSNKQVELSFKNRKYFEFCSSSWATHRSARCLPTTNTMNQKYSQRCDTDYNSFCSTNKNHPVENIDSLFVQDESLGLNRKLISSDGSSSLHCSLPSLNYTPESSFRAHQSPFLTFKNYSLLGSSKDSTLGSSIHLLNNNFQEHESKMPKDCCSSSDMVSYGCGLPNIEISNSFLSLSDGRQNILEESSDILNLCNCPLPDFDESVCASLESGDYDEFAFNPPFMIDSRPRSKRFLQNVAPSLSDSLAHMQPFDFYDTSLINDISSDFSFNRDLNLKMHEGSKHFVCSSTWKPDSAKVVPLRGNSSTLSLHNQSNFLMGNFAQHHEPNSFLDKNQRRNFASDDCQTSSSIKRSIKSEKSHSYKRSRTMDYGTNYNKHCQVSESQERLFGEDWLRNNSDIYGHFEVTKPNPNLTDYMTTNKTDSWLPQLDVEVEEEVVETVEHKELNAQYDPQISSASQESNCENFSSFIDYFLESWYDDDIVCPFSEEILQYMEEESDRLKSPQS